MPIFSAYVREEWYYSVDDLKTIFSFNAANYQTIENANKHFKYYLKELLSLNIIKEKRKNDNHNSEIDILFENYTDDKLIDSAVKYKFEFVGILIFQNVITYVYPKYLGESDSILSAQPVKEMQQVMAVIEKYSREKSIQDFREVKFFSDIDNHGEVNVLSVMLYLLEDYALNGEYEDIKEIIELNGTGQISWQKTVDKTYPIFSNNKPYYVELFTRNKISNNASFMKRLHAYVVTKCSKEMERTGLTAFFGLPIPDISSYEQANFGDTDFIINRIDEELTQVFEDRKINVLTAMKAYFKSSKIVAGDNKIQIMGTRSFNLIWEEVCTKVFYNQKGDSKLRHPNLNEIKPRIDYDIINKNFKQKPPTLVEIIEQPIWKKYGKGNKGIPKRSLVPDYLRFEKKKNSRNYVFYILDAKYYCPVWKNNSIKDQPGVDDVVKQYLYHLAYQDILTKYNITEVKNYFLMPKRQTDPAVPGFVKLNSLKKLGLGVIEIRMLAPEMMYEKYINNEHLNLNELK